MKKVLEAIACKRLLLSFCALLAVVIVCFLFLWQYELRPMFRDLTIEAGSSLPPISDFLIPGVNPERASMVTQADQIDISHVGEQKLTFAYGKKRETVTLTIVDTTPPVVVFCDVFSSIDSLPSAEDFVESIHDFSIINVSLMQNLEIPEEYGEAAVQVVVEDEYGNRTVGKCHVYYVWMHKYYTLELGDRLRKSDLLLTPWKHAALLDQSALNRINQSPVGTYVIESVDPDEDSRCVVTVIDTVAPVLEVKPVEIDSYDEIGKEGFIVKTYDISGQVETRLLSQLDNTKVGTQTVKIEARDINGNVTVAETTLTVHEDSTPPVLFGVDPIQVAKNATVDYLAGVSAWDKKDGEVEFSYDASRVDLTKSGDYYVIYTTSDSKGNTTTYRRKIVVDHSAEDTAALVKEFSANIGQSVESIRNYLYGTIHYSADWGGDDPVWYGLTARKGNCYVHALCFQTILEEKGYETMLIWCEDKSHYWVLVKVDGAWKHTDSTPSPQHHLYPLMSDDQRHETLDGRDWDRSAWPKCS